MTAFFIKFEQLEQASNYHQLWFGLTEINSKFTCLLSGSTHFYLPRWFTKRCPVAEQPLKPNDLSQKVNKSEKKKKKCIHPVIQIQSNI